MNNLTIDIFYKTCQKDYPFLYHSLRSIKKYALGFKKIVLVTDYGQKKELERIVDEIGLLDVMIFELDQDIDIYAPTRLPKFFCKMKKKINLATGIGSRAITPDRIGYEVQKAVKCDWPNWSSADAVVQIDSDTILTDTLNAESFFVDERPVWFKRKWEQCIWQAAKMWKKGTLYFYNKEDFEYHYMVHPIFFVTKELAMELKKYVNEMHGCSFYRLFTNPKFPRMSEYDLLGFYADNNQLKLEYKVYDLDESAGPLPTCKYFSSWKGMTDEVRDEIEKALN